ncbi:MAG: flagellar motor protein MotB [Thermoleophilaceae bacterium]
MSTRRGHRRSRRGGYGAGHENEDRWLLTYADMITLLMALFMVLFSITSVNKAKLQVLTKTLQHAFSGEILPGGKSIQQNGGGPEVHHEAPQPPIPAIQPLIAQQSRLSGKTPQSARAAEQQDFKRLKAQVDSYARSHGLQREVETVIDQRGLVIRLLTDQVLFDSGAADLKGAARPVLGKVAGLLRTESGHATMVEGHTDSVPIRGAIYPTNWELSTARAARVVRFLVNSGVSSRGLGAAGYASLHPLSTNDTAGGRSRNRRVEIVLLRSGQGARGGGGS